MGEKPVKEQLKEAERQAKLKEPANDAARNASDDRGATPEVQK